MRAAFSQGPKPATSVSPAPLQLVIPEYVPKPEPALADAADESAPPRGLLYSGNAEVKNPIDSTLLNPLDSTTAEAAAKATAAHVEPPKEAALGPIPQASEPKEPAPRRQAQLPELDLPTPAQVRQRRLETAPSSFATEEKQKRRRHRSKVAPKSEGRRGDAEGRGFSYPRRQREGIMRSGGSGSSRMHGQDSLEVRSVTLANGQKANLILEEGRLQRIVAANGQVAELRWNPPALNRAAGPQTHLSVKLHQGVTGQNAADNSSPNVPATIRRWANSLNSQRLTTGPSATFRKDALLSAPSGYADRASTDARPTSDPEDRQIAAPKRRSFMQGLLSLPSNVLAKDQPQADMPTILETNREVNRDWNPIHESWLPSTMTTQFLQGDPSKLPKRNDQETGGTLTGLSVGRSVGDNKKLTQSLDARLGMPTHNDSFNFHDGQARRASIGGGDPPALIAGMYDSDPGQSGDLQRKRSFWKAIKRMLHLPTVMKVRSPKGQRSEGDVAKRRSFVKRFSFGAANRKGPSKSQKEGLKHLPDQNGEGFFKPRQRSTPVIPDGYTDVSGGSLGSQTSSHVKSKSLNESDRSGGAETFDLAGRHRAAEVAVPATPQQSSVARRGVEGTPSTPLDDHLADMPVTPSAAQSLNMRLGGAGELIDTTELRAALAQRKSLRETQLSLDEGTDKSSSLRSQRRRRNLDLEKPSLSKLRTMMAGKWQKNFTEGTSGNKVDELLQVSSLQRLARERIVEMEIVETEETFEMVWHIPLNGSASKISKTDRYLKNGEVVEAARRDGRPGVLRSQLTFTPEGHVHIRALQGEPFSAVFHDRIKLSTGGRRIKIEQKFQLLQPGVLPVKHHSIWNRVE